MSTTRPTEWGKALFGPILRSATFFQLVNLGEAVCDVNRGQEDKEKRGLGVAVFITVWLDRPGVYVFGLNRTYVYVCRGERRRVTVGKLLRIFMARSYT